DLADYLYKSVDARDLPAMADIDSSLLYFCKIVKRYNKVVLTGECADEIFGGYPWFHKKEFFEKDTFPWMPDLEPRKVMLSDEFLNELKMDEYVKKTYKKSVAETPLLDGEKSDEKRRREISYLNLKWFMQTLLDRMDRTSMFSGLEARVPFADHRIIEYVWNVPWKFKYYNNTVKGLLREAARGLVPDEILFRRKSPYPKVYDPNYEKLLKSELTEVIEDNSSPVLQFLDKKKVYKFLSSPSDYGKPWFGQLMAGPQMMGYLIQVNYWMKKFDIEIV
ncbi:MAG: asparagine synthase C-terminal domain-containing protein, partial [Clostridia bacterium]|nr:asparagine synthase C-terminal domain-containing protein [Clostridia bacterium]